MANILSTERINEHTTVHRLDDGTKQAVIQAGQNYMDRDTGEWKAYDPAIAIDTIVAGYSHSHKTAQAWKRFGKGHIRFGFKPGLFVTYVGRGMAAVDPVISGDTATYANAWPSTDLRVRVFPEGFKEDIILKTSAAPPSFTFDLAELGAVTPTQVGNTVEYIETLTGKTVGRIPEPFAVDAAGVRGPVTLTLDGSAVTLAVDSAWLADPVRVFPVIVDPTTTVTQPGTSADTFINSSATTTNYGTAISIDLFDDNASQRDGLLQLALPTLNASAQIVSAYLKLYCYTLNNNLVSHKLHKNLASWTETGVTWANAPSYDATVSASVTISTVNTWGIWDITSLVAGWYASPASNYGVRLLGRYPGSGVAANSVFYSKEHTDPSLRPILEITWKVVPTVSITSPNGTQASPTIYNNQVSGMTLSGVYTNNNSENMASKQVQILDASNNVVWDSGTITETATSGSTVNTVVPSAAGLKYNTAYQWLWRATDTDGDTSAWSSAGWFKCLMTAPTGLTVTGNAATARIDLSWSALGAESQAGYDVLRDGTKVNTAVVTGTTYNDDTAASGKSYAYTVRGVANDGYLGPQGTGVAGNVSITGAWLGSKQVTLRRPPAFRWPRRASKRLAVDGTWVLQDRGYAPRELDLEILFQSLTERDDLITLLAADAILSYRDQAGNVLRGKVTGDSKPDTWRADAGFWPVTLTEVSVT